MVGAHEDVAKRSADHIPEAPWGKGKASANNVRRMSVLLLHIWGMGERVFSSIEGGALFLGAERPGGMGERVFSSAREERSDIPLRAKISFPQRHPDMH